MMDKSVVKSVIYVLDQQLTFNPNERAFHAAQQYALDAELPFAVVGVLDDESRAVTSKKGLVSAERTLAKQGIPLILLVGNRSNALKGFAGHVSSLMVMQDHLDLVDDALKKHPHMWPGHIEGVGAVLRMIRDNPSMCRF
jgi:hypothetical protein